MAGGGAILDHGSCQKRCDSFNGTTALVATCHSVLAPGTTACCSHHSPRYNSYYHMTTSRTREDVEGPGQLGVPEVRDFDLEEARLGPQSKRFPGCEAFPYLAPGVLLVGSSTTSFQGERCSQMRSCYSAPWQNFVHQDILQLQVSMHLAKQVLPALVPRHMSPFATICCNLLLQPSLAAVHY